MFDWGTRITYKFRQLSIIMYNTRHLAADEILCEFVDIDNLRKGSIIQP